MLGKKKKRPKYPILKYGLPETQGHHVSSQTIFYKYWSFTRALLKWGVNILLEKFWNKRKQGKSAETAPPSSQPRSKVAAGWRFAVTLHRSRAGPWWSSSHLRFSPVFCMSGSESFQDWRCMAQWLPTQHPLKSSGPSALAEVSLSWLAAVLKPNSAVGKTQVIWEPSLMLSIFISNMFTLLSFLTWLLIDDLIRT